VNAATVSVRDRRRVAVRLERWFPGSLVWFGAATGHWWAAVPVFGSWRLVEAVSPEELGEALARLPVAGVRWQP
jgi:hypothetical protein